MQNLSSKKADDFRVPSPPIHTAKYGNKEQVEEVGKTLIIFS